MLAWQCAITVLFEQGDGGVRVVADGQNAARIVVMGIPLSVLVEYHAI